jgi:hypothetical protein
MIKRGIIKTYQLLKAISCEVVFIMENSVMSGPGGPLDSRVGLEEKIKAVNARDSTVNHQSRLWITGLVRVLLFAGKETGVVALSNNGESKLGVVTRWCSTLLEGVLNLGQFNIHNLAEFTVGNAVSENKDVLWPRVFLTLLIPQF